MIRTRPQHRIPSAPTRPLQLAAQVLRVALIAATLAACAPRVAVEAPKEPITINLNVKIEHEVRVKIDRELDDLFNKKPELF